MTNTLSAALRDLNYSCSSLALWTKSANNVRKVTRCDKHRKPSLKRSKCPQVMIPGGKFRIFEKEPKIRDWYLGAQHGVSLFLNRNVQSWIISKTILEIFPTFTCYNTGRILNNFQSFACYFLRLKIVSQNLSVWNLCRLRF